MHHITHYSLLRNILFIVLSTFVLACSYRPVEKKLQKFQNNDSQIVGSFYKAKNDTIELVRLLTNEKKLTVKEGRIWNGNYGLTHQQFDATVELEYHQDYIDSLSEIYLNDGMVPKLGDERDVMFIQIIPDLDMSTTDALGFLNLRQEIEGKIDQVLTNKNLGEWFAGDMGAGANMLFFIDNWEAAWKEVRDLLEKEKLIDHVLVAKRINLSADNWNYEIVYPFEFEGDFRSF